MAPARTGITPISKAAVIVTAHGYNDTCSSVVWTRRAYIQVTMRLIAPVRLLAPALWSDTRNRSTDIPACDALSDSGG